MHRATKLPQSGSRPPAPSEGGSYNLPLTREVSPPMAVTEGETMQTTPQSAAADSSPDKGSHVKSAQVPYASL